MKAGVLSDIHGNAWALEAVLEDAARLGVDRWFDLGDMLYGPLEPAETFRMLGRLSAVSVRGNEDRIVVEASDGVRERDAAVGLVLAALPAEAVEWLRALPALYDDGRRIRAFHGTPASDTTYLVEDVSSGRARERAVDEIARLAGVSAASVLLCGHSHLQHALELPDGRLVVNPGSAGLPAYRDDVPAPHRMQAGSPHASYAVIELRAGGWAAELRRVAYNHRAAAGRARRAGRRDWEKWLLTGTA